MSTIPTKLSDSQFHDYVLPFLSQAKRGFVCKIPLFKVFNYILYWLHTGCQWENVPIDPNVTDPEQPEISHYSISITIENGLVMAAWRTFGSIASTA